MCCNVLQLGVLFCHGLGSKIEDWERDLWYDSFTYDLKKTKRTQRLGRNVYLRRYALHHGACVVCMCVFVYVRVCKCVCVCMSLYKYTRIYMSVISVNRKNTGYPLYFFGHTVVADQVQNNERASNANQYTILFIWEQELKQSSSRLSWCERNWSSKEGPSSIASHKWNQDAIKSDSKKNLCTTNFFEISVCLKSLFSESV